MDSNGTAVNCFTKYLFSISLDQVHKSILCDSSTEVGGQTMQQKMKQKAVSSSSSSTTRVTKRGNGGRGQRAAAPSSAAVPPPKPAIPIQGQQGKL